MRLFIKSDGTTKGTTVINTETGAVIPNISELFVSAHASDRDIYVSLTLTPLMDLEIEAKTEDHESEMLFQKYLENDEDISVFNTRELKMLLNYLSNIGRQYYRQYLNLPTSDLEVIYDDRDSL